MIDWSNSVSLRIASRMMRAGGIVAYPTEAVWGLGCDPFNKDAVSGILTLKQRPVHKGLILVAATMEQVDFLIHDLNATARDHLQQSWPGPNTWIIPHKQRVPEWVHGDHDGVAVRVSDHPLVQTLCRLYGGPIVSTSANPQSRPPAKTHWQVRKYFTHASELDFITQGVVGKRQRPSVIRDLASMALIRS